MSDALPTLVLSSAIMRSHLRRGAPAPIHLHLLPDLTNCPNVLCVMSFIGRFGSCWPQPTDKRVGERV